MTRTRWSRLVVASAAAMLAVSALSACSDANSAQNAIDPANPWVITGATTSTGPSGPRDGVPDTDRQAENSDGGEMDRLALNAVADIEEFWTENYAATFPGEFRPVSRLISWDAGARESESVEFCGISTHELVNAAYCGDETIGWDRGVLLPELVDRFGEMAVVMVLAHEYGHALQIPAGIATEDSPGLVTEQQADCLAGVFLRYVAEGNSRHFDLNTGDGLNGVLGATVAVRDRDPDNPDNVHGSAFERVTAVQMGYLDGAGSCAAIDEDEIEQRRSGLPVTFDPGEESMQLEVTEDSLADMADALADILPVAETPGYEYDGVPARCADATPAEPVGYCPAGAVIGTDVDALAERAGESVDPDEPLSAIVAGDYNAFVVFVSRYTLAYQDDKQLTLTGAETAGLRTACLSGAVTTALSRPDSALRLSAGDLDEAVSGLLADGLAAADVNGDVVPEGYLRLEAFRLGVFDGASACLNEYQ
ncbi:metallopeptidase [Nocardia sp. NPDC024068]|uniref:metallopeptidase n=1 Tax=Nocardia sp. NPDC024068 TaxID=3157197 RepID=UPI0033E22CBE